MLATVCEGDFHKSVSNYTLQQLHTVDTLEVVYREDDYVKKCSESDGQKDRMIDTLHTLASGGSNDNGSNLYGTSILELTDLITGRIELYSVLQSCPNLKSLLIEYALSDDILWYPRRRAKADPRLPGYLANSIASSPPTIHKLDTLILRHPRIVQAQLESLIKCLPCLRTFEVRFMRPGDVAPDRPSHFKRQKLFCTLAISCPLLELVHISINQNVLTAEEFREFQAFFPALPGLSVTWKDLARQQRLLSNGRIENLLFNHYANYLTKLEILCYTDVQGDIMDGLHEFLCHARFLKHLIAPRVQYWSEYLDLELRPRAFKFRSNSSSSEADSDNSSYFFPRCKRVPKKFDWRIRSRGWACRDLETLHLGFRPRFANTTDAEYSRNMFGYISRYCPKLKTLIIKRSMVNLKLDGGLCLLTRLKDLEQLKIYGHSRLFDLNDEDISWIGHEPDGSKDLECLLNPDDKMLSQEIAIVAEAVKAPQPVDTSRTIGKANTTGVFKALANRLDNRNKRRSSLLSATTAALSSPPDVMQQQLDRIAQVFEMDEKWYASLRHETSGTPKLQHRLQRMMLLQSSRSQRHQNSEVLKMTDNPAPLIGYIGLPFVPRSESEYRCWPHLQSFVLGVEPAFVSASITDTSLIRKLRPDISFSVTKWGRAQHSI
ncbi:hypothetical protein BGZ99_005404 [Dissophora globulifera]|uniref:Uncharacterized protein n=1 Tax=Dissophora globulifera TaxID=979702 RepID=A0A9P6RTF6_9FUNG|nr:hypothetical protein BGZ99_005404 [Dissophora globulifera]